MSKSIGKMAGSNYATQEDYDRYLNEFIRNNPPPYNEGIQYAQNNSGNIATDAQYVNNPNYISDEDLYAKMRANIKEYENFIENPYLDTKGYITTGYGANINNKEDFMKVNFMINGKPATDAEKEQYYYHLRDMSMLVDENNKFVYHNTKAENFAKSTPLRISQEDALNMAQNHMINDLAQVRREFANFDDLPIPLKEVLLDIQYNVKGGIKKANWPKLYQAIVDKNINKIAANVSREDVQQKRNDWADRMARSISF